MYIAVAQLALFKILFDSFLLLLSCAFALSWVNCNVYRKKIKNYKDVWLLFLLFISLYHFFLCVRFWCGNNKEHKFTFFLLLHILKGFSSIYKASLLCRLLNGYYYMLCIHFITLFFTSVFCSYICQCPAVKYLYRVFVAIFFLFLYFITSCTSSIFKKMLLWIS